MFPGQKREFGFVFGLLFLESSVLMGPGKIRDFFGSEKKNALKEDKWKNLEF